MNTMENHQPDMTTFSTSNHLSTSPSTCTLCGGGRRVAQKRRKNCPGRCHRTISDEPHWSKLLQTCQVPANTSRTPTTSPPVSPMAAFGQSVSRFFKWITPNKRTSRRNSMDESDRPTSVSSEGSGACPESPIPKLLYRGTSCQQLVTKSALVVQPVPIMPDNKHTNLQMPASSTLMTKRLNEKHKVQKPTPVLPANVTTDKHINGEAGQMMSDGNKPNVNDRRKQSCLPETLGIPGQTPTPSPSPTSNGHLPLTVASSCPIQQNKHSQSSDSRPHIADTWPLCNYHLTYYDEDTEDVFENDENNPVNSSRNVEEFTIPYENTHRDELIGVWRSGCVYKGRWHGSVMIVTYDMEDDKVVKEFWEEVKTMSRIRHENIVLFMGACTEPGNLALVTSVCNGISLCEKLHIARERLSLVIKINLAYQIAQALAYLHAKKIVYKNLTSKNVFIEKQKVTLSVINFSLVYKSKESEKVIGPLPYLAPELLTYLIPHKKLDLLCPYTHQSDIYAYGILLHELISGTKPYKDIPKDALVLQVINGRRPSTEKLACPQTLKTLMENCWTPLPHHRPYTQEILKELQKKDVALHNRFSSSAPDNINKLKSNNLF